MEWFKNNADWIGVIISILIAVIAFTVTTWRYTNVRRAEQRQQEFENYHKLIRWLVEGYPDGKAVMLDSQIAFVFELRHYRKYQEVSVRILQGLQKKWEKEFQKIKDDDERKSKERLLEEISTTLTKLK